jgi:hypothetical protein
VNAPFDPYRHEAVERVMTDEHPEGHVVEVFQTGYALNERVLQPAAVKVAVPQASESKPEGEGSSSPGAEVKPGAPEETETEKQASQDQREE